MENAGAAIAAEEAANEPRAPPAAAPRSGASAAARIVRCNLLLAWWSGHRREDVDRGRDSSPSRVKASRPRTPRSLGQVGLQLPGNTQSTSMTAPSAACWGQFRQSPRTRRIRTRSGAAVVRRRCLPDCPCVGALPFLRRQPSRPCRAKAKTLRAQPGRPRLSLETEVAVPRTLSARRESLARDAGREV